MKRTILLATVALLGACSEPHEADGDVDLDEDPVVPDDDEPAPGDPPPDGPGDDEALEDVPCTWTQVYDAPGPVFEVREEESAFFVEPLAEGEGFYCFRVEVDVVLPDNLEDLPREDDDCPTHLALAGFYGSAPGGEYMATSFFRSHDQIEGECVPGEPRVEVGNYLDYTESASRPWQPGERYHAVLEARPWVTRLTLTEMDGTPVGPPVHAALWNATVEDTRDPVVRLGQNKITGGLFFPWFGLRYENLSVFAAVAPAKSGQEPDSRGRTRM